MVVIGDNWRVEVNSLTPKNILIRIRESAARWSLIDPVSWEEDFQGSRDEKGIN